MEELICQLGAGLQKEKQKITLNAENIDEKLTEQYSGLPCPRLMNASEKCIFKMPLNKAFALSVKCNNVILASHMAQPDIIAPANTMRQFLLHSNQPAQIPTKRRPR